MFRGAVAEVLAEQHLRWLWAAYRKGALGRLGLAPDIDRRDFRAALDEVLAPADWASIMVAPSSAGRAPCGIAIGKTMTGTEGATLLWSGGFVWFPWASPRNRLECVAALLARCAAEGCTFVHAGKPADAKFWRRLIAAGFVREVGPIILRAPDPMSSREGMLYQGQG